jgi:hypothetical protein
VSSNRSPEIETEPKDYLHKAKAKRRQSCFVSSNRSPENQAEEPNRPRFAVKRTRRSSLFNPPIAQVKPNVQNSKPDQVKKFVPDRKLIERARKEISDSELEKRLPKPATDDYEMEDEFKDLLDMIPSPQNNIKR